MGLKMDWKKAVSMIAPAIGTAIGSPFGGMAIKLVTDALGIPEKSNDEKINEAIKNNPDALLKLKEADQQFTIKMEELGIQKEQLVYSDIANSRDREIKTGDSITPRCLAFFVTIGFFSILFYLLAKGTPDSGGEALLIMLGGLGAAWTGIIAYYFGSSAGSARKTEMMTKPKK